MNETHAFAARAGMFVALLLIGIALLNQAYLTLVVPQKQQYRIEEEYQTMIGKEKTFSSVLLGGSHTQFGIDPHFLPHSFNLGFNSNTYIEDYYKLRKMMLADGVTASYVLVEFDLHSFSSYNIEGEHPLKSEGWYYAPLVPRSDYYRLSRQSPIKTFALLHAPVLGNGFDFASAYQKQAGLYRGWYNATGDFRTMDMQRVAMRRARGQFVGKERVDPLLLDYYERILTLAKERQSTVILIRYPVSKEYADALVAIGLDRERYDRLIKEKTRAIIGETTMLDYSGLFLDHPEYFNDPDHLNALGAGILTRRICTDLERLSAGTSMGQDGQTHINCAEEAIA